MLRDDGMQNIGLSREEYARRELARYAELAKRRSEMFRSSSRPMTMKRVKAKYRPAVIHGERVMRRVEDGITVPYISMLERA